MNIYLQDSVLLSDIPITSSAEHEEELMKSDFVKLSWSDSEKRTIPVDAYIIPYGDGIRYSLLEPYEPEQKSGTEFLYEPRFQHPKMQLSKVTFKRPSKDSDANDITLLDWSYVGEIYTLLQYFCDQINDALDLSGHQAFGFTLKGELDDNLASVSFQTVDILSALSTVANTLNCEWHLDWSQKTLYFGRIMYLRSSSAPLLLVGDNISVPSVRNSKDGFWNAFEPQGSTRNITRRAASGEFVQANVRLSLRGDKYPDGIVYTDGDGRIVTKAEFKAIGVRPFIKSLIFEDIFPKLDLYAYNIRYRERFLLEDNDNPESKVISYYDDNGNPVYKKYAVWYMRLAYPTYDEDGNVTAWADYDISDVRDMSTTVKEVLDNDLDSHYIRIDLDISVSRRFFTKESTQYRGTFIVSISAGGVTVKGYIDEYYFSQDGTCRFYTEYSEDGADERDETDLEKMTAFQNAISEGVTVTFVDGVKRSEFPAEYSQIVDGKELYGQFKVNTRDGAESTPLAGRGKGDNGNYGFGLVYLGIEGDEYIKEANKEPTEEGDTGVVDMKGVRAVVTENDYEIVFQQSDSYIMPTTVADMMIPKGGMSGDEYIKDISSLKDKNDGLTGNIVNLYNIVMGSEYEESARKDLENATKKYINNSLDDNNSYTFKSDPLEFSKQTHSSLYIGQKVNYADGKTYTSDSPLETRIMKLITKLDFAFEQEITVGNEVLKGNQQTLKEQVQSYASYGAAGGGGGDGMSMAALRQFLKSEGMDLFLSKQFDDEAHGLIGFLKGAWFGAKEWIIDNLGNANLKNVTVNGILRALNSYINKVRSTNYSGDGMLDTGWQIINDYEGSNSKAVFDFLYIRKKAIFEELEIRKLSHIGGNFCLSPSSGRVWRVELYDSEVGGNLLGYSEVTIPYTLGGTMLSLFKKLFKRQTGAEGGHYLLGRKKLIARKLTPEEIAACKRIRVYMFSDDGSTKTMQNWTVGAQARCQTFNIEKQMEHISGGESDNPDVEYWTGKKVQNHYWWRLVTATGEGLCDDGKKHAYIEFLENQYNQRTHSDVGSDIPEVGDEFGQFGHRTRADQSNVVMIETANEDSPAMKFYHGINSWNLNGKRPIILSPTLVEMKASMFRWITSYGDDTGQVTKRGLWVNITPDSQGNRRCYPNDVVSHNGTSWRCIVASGTHKETKDGRWLTQAEVDAMTLEEQMELLEVENYTVMEPSATATDWTEYTDEAIAPYIKFSEALIAVPCEKDRKASEAVSKTITAKLMVTNLEATITSLSIEGADSFVRASGSNIIVSVPKNTAVTNKDYIVTIEGDCLNNHYIATDKISVFAAVRGDDAYEIHTTPAHWIWNQEGANLTPEEIIKALEDGTELTFSMLIDGVELLPDGVTMGNSCAQISVTNDGVAMPFVINSVATSEPHIGVSYNNQTGRVWVTSVPETLESGWVDVAITYGDNAHQTIRIPFYCNLLGTWREQIIGDTRVAIADKTKYLDDQYTEFHGEFVQNSSEQSAKFRAVTKGLTGVDPGADPSAAVIETKTAEYKNAVDQNLMKLERTITGAAGEKYSNTRLDTAEGSITEMRHDIDGVNGKFSEYSTTEQTSSMISSTVSRATEGMVTSSNFVQTAQGFEFITSSEGETIAQGKVDGLEDKYEEAGMKIRNDGSSQFIGFFGDVLRFSKANGTSSWLYLWPEYSEAQFGNFIFTYNNPSHLDPYGPANALYSYWNNERAVIIHAQGQIEVNRASGSSLDYAVKADSMQILSPTSYGLRVASDGVKMTSNGGMTWNSVGGSSWGDLSGVVQENNEFNIIASSDNNDFNGVLHIGYRQRGSSDFLSKEITEYVFHKGQGDTKAPLTASAFNQSSDIRLKDIIEYFELSAQQIASAPLIKFTWKNDSSKKASVGSIAQYWQNVLPEAVTESEGYLVIDYSKLSISSVISLARKVVDDARRIESLERTVEMLKDEIQEIKNSINK